jgi:hypothetical protein
MKALLLAAVAVALTAVANLSLASAAGPSVFGGNPWPGALQSLGARAADTTNRTPHYEWQYRYVGPPPAIRRTLGIGAVADRRASLG